ncbi:MAG TPA: hypothetical protein VGX68_16605 [Thermoanaerobaculia bacterium]|jgi:hypothetical protein|nr:hypothetical protein [Thermoanaerobaculia bacterium]
MESAGSGSVWAGYAEVLPSGIAPSFIPLLDQLAALLDTLKPAAGRTCLALFDTGPGQLGLPRVTQVAVLLALARRAEEIGGRLAWGILQEPGAPLVTDSTPESFRRLLAARTAREASEAQIAAWRARLEDGTEGDEIWVIGAPRLGPPPELNGAAHLLIRDPLDPEARRLGVVLRRGEWAAGEVWLDPPEESACVRLLRGAASPSLPMEELEAPAAAARVDLVEEESPSTPSPPEESGEPHRQRPAGGLGMRFATSLRQLTGRTALASRLSRAVGRRHAAYVRKLQEMFESGDIDNVLRHAIPLTAEAGPRRLPVRSFAPRSDLHIRPERSRPWSTAEISPALHGELRRLYRDAFHRLEAQDRIEEAAFLLAEVLHADEEAVAFLERHGRLRLAAEMAEARDLPPGLVVRQWFLAGDQRRGLRIARRASAFADAVTRLERSRRAAEAVELRRLWARELAGAGDYAAAVDVLWPLPDERRRTLEWMDRAIEEGGAPAGRMLARKVALAPELFAELRGPALAFLESWRAEGAAGRLAFADAIRRGPQTPAATSLARAALRAVVRDSGRFGARMEKEDLRQLASFAGDPTLRADVLALPLPAREPWISRRETWRVEIAACDAGTMPVHDAAFLPNGLTAVALGEAGVRLLSRAGRTVAELDQPAHRLVVSDHGDRAIALARRGDAWRLARLDFLSRKAETWCEARLQAFAPAFDGALWFVAGADGLVAVEPAAERFDGSWGVSRLPGETLAIARSSTRCSLAFDGDGPEVWTYELPSLTLRRRDSVPPAVGLRRSPLMALSPEGMLVETFGGSGRRIVLHVQGASRFAVTLRGQGKPAEPAVAGDWAALPVHTPEAILIHLVHLPSAAVRAEIALDRAAQVTLRLTPQSLTLADDRGRVMVLDLENGQVRRDFRV